MNPPPLPGDLGATVANAIREDLGDGDVTAALVDDGVFADATVICREQAVICGLPWFNEVFLQLDATVEIDWLVADGDRVENNALVCNLAGPARSLLTGERTALNFLQTLSATATQARQYADAVAGAGCRILDTRKTIPGLRSAQKYAVHCGGGTNHRHGLYDAILIKENHIVAADSIESAVAKARKQSPSLPVQVEVESIGQLEEAIAAGADSVLLDNFDHSMLKSAVSCRASLGSNIVLEASGGYDLPTIRETAETGVDFISVGALTKHVRAVDLSMRFKARH